MSKTLAFLEEFGITIPPASDFATVLRVWQAAADIAEQIEGEPKIEQLLEKLERKKARNSELEGDLMDQEDKSFKDVMIPELQQENRLLRAQIESPSTGEVYIAHCEEKLAAGRGEANRETAVENELVEAKRMEAEALSTLEALEAQVQLLESGQAIVEEELKEAEALRFACCKGIVVVLALELNLELMQPEHQVIGSKVVRLNEGQPVEEAEILHQLESD